MAPLQKGLQTAHTVSNLFVKYERVLFAGKSEYRMLKQWAENYKTIIILNGGNSAELLQIYNELMLLNSSLVFPFTKFEEDIESLNGALTCVSLVIPMNYIKGMESININRPEYELTKLINRYTLAN